MNGVLEASSSIDDFVRAPLGRYLSGPTFLVWCADPSLCGAIYWGSPSVSDVGVLEQLYEIYQHPDMRAPFDVLTDARFVRGVEVAAFDRLLGYLRRRRAAFGKRLRKNAIVHPDGLVGAIVGGLYPLLGPRYEWKPFREIGPALSWLKHRGAEELTVRLDGMARELGEPSLAVRVRALLQNDPSLSLDEIAAAFHVLPRTLQRELRREGVTMKKERAVARAALGRELLLTSGRSINEVRKAMGFRSRGYIAASISSLTGATPHKFRRSHRP